MSSFSKHQAGQETETGMGAIIFIDVDGTLVTYENVLP